MRRKLKKLLLLAVIACPFWIASFFVNVWLGVALAALGAVLCACGLIWWLRHGFLTRINNRLNEYVKRTNWFKNQFVGIKQFVSNEGYRDNIIRNYDIVNLGSNPARFAFFYENVRGQSWATGSQGQDMDFEILKYFHSYLKEGGTVLIPIMPFTAISPFIATRKDFWGPAYYSKFYQILDWHQKEQLPYVDEIKEYLQRPLTACPWAKRFILNDVPADNRYDIVEQPMMAAELEQDATIWIKGWCDEFRMKTLNEVFDARWQPYYDEAVSINRKMVDYCLERGYKPVFICVPMTKYLAEKFPADVRKHLVTDFVEKCNIRGIPFLDYTLDPRFQNPAFYFNSFFLNLRGRKAFTRRVLRDIGLVGEIPPDAGGEMGKESSEK